MSATINRITARLVAYGIGMRPGRPSWSKKKPRASKDDVLKKWFLEQSPQQQKFFMMDLPLLIDKWFVGRLDGAQKSDHLIQGSTQINAYTVLDSLVIGLMHMKPMFPPPKAKKLYRLVGQSSAPGPKVTLTPKNVLKPLMSWATTPKIQTHLNLVKKAKYGVLLEWDADNKWVVATTESIYNLSAAAISMFDNLNDEDPKKVWDMASNRWEGPRGVMEDMEGENEALVYLPRGKSMECKAKIIKGK